MTPETTNKQNIEEHIKNLEQARTRMIEDYDIQAIDIRLKYWNRKLKEIES